MKTKIFPTKKFSINFSFPISNERTNLAIFFCSFVFVAASARALQMDQENRRVKRDWHKSCTRILLITLWCQKMLKKSCLPMAIYFHCIAVATIEIPNPLIDLLNVLANSKKIANFVMRFSLTENEIQNSFFFWSFHGHRDGEDHYLEYKLMTSSIILWDFFFLLCCSYN